jgi:hypothetical protein
MGAPGVFQRIAISSSSLIIDKETPKKLKFHKNHSKNKKIYKRNSVQLQLQIQKKKKTVVNY